MKLLSERSQSRVPLEAKASIAYIICSVLVKGISFFTIPIFTRLMSTEQYGQVSLYNAWSTVIALLITLNLPYGSFQTAMIKYEDEQEKYVASLDGIYISLSILILAIFIPLHSILEEMIGLPLFILIIMIAQATFGAFTQTWMGLMRFKIKYKAVIVVSIILALFSQIVALLFVFSFEEKGYAKITGVAIVSMTMGLAMLVIGIKNGGKPFNKDMWRYAFRFNIPLLIYYFSQIIFNQSDIIMIEYFCGLADVGIYNIAYSIGMILSFLISATQSSYTPWFYRKLNEGNEIEDRNIAPRICCALALLLWLVISLAPELVYFFGGAKYSAAAWAIPPVAASCLLLFYSCLFDRILFFYEKKFLLTLATIISGIANIILNIFLLPHFGFVAAGYTTLISYVLLVLFDIIFSKRVAQEKCINLQMFDNQLLLGVFGLFVICSSLMVPLYELPGLRFLLLGIVFLAIAIKRKRVFAFFSATYTTIREK